MHPLLLASRALAPSMLWYLSSPALCCALAIVVAAPERAATDDEAPTVIGPRAMQPVVPDLTRRRTGLQDLPRSDLCALRCGQLLRLRSSRVLQMRHRGRRQYQPALRGRRRGRLRRQRQRSRQRLHGQHLQSAGRGREGRSPGALYLPGGQFGRRLRPMRRWPVLHQHRGCALVPGFRRAACGGEIICSCPITVADPDTATFGYQIAGPFPCEADYFQNCDSATTNRRTGTTIPVGAPTGVPQLLTLLLDGPPVPPFNQCPSPEGGG